MALSPSFNSTPLPLDSPALASEGVSNSSGRDPSDSGVGPSIPEPEPLALMVIDKPIVEKPGLSRSEPEPLALAVIDKPAMEKPGMPHDLRVGFGKRHHKRLYKAIELGSSSAKGAQSEGVQEEPEREILSLLVPSPNVTRSDNALVAAEGKTSPTPRGASDNAAPTKGVFFIRDTPAPASPLSCDEMMEMLKRISHSINVDLPSSRMFETVEVVIPCWCFFFFCFPSRCTCLLADI